ncbi:MAG TPA: hypothetical protein VD838_00965 [Anaeromyxobacteraceae bacterium]|nr:hypothetical protein [Anaeromyxobacteraceae bacterium]
MASDDTTRDVAIVAALAVGTSYDDIAKKHRVSKRTLVRWMAEPAFRAEVRRARASILDETIGALAAEGAETVRVLAKLRGRAKSEHVRLGAARTILERLTAVRELLDNEEVLERLAALEGKGTVR